ncbi:MAG: radical SAM/SPASM domain-containing protein [Acidobacteriota bacterium]
MILLKEAASPANLQVELVDLARRMEVSKIEDMLYFPKYFQIETTRICNAKCPFCAIDIWDKSVPYMDDALFQKIADELIQYKDWVKFCDLQRSGEPLMDTKIYDRVKYLKDGGMKLMAVTTNASALNERNGRRLLQAGIDEVMISIDSVEKERYEKLRIGLKYETVMHNIKTFFRLRDEIRPQCIVRVRGVSFHDPSNPDDVEDIRQWEAFWAHYRKPHDRIYMKRAHNWGNQKALDESPEYHWVYHPCIIPFSTMHITAMGHTALCPQDFDGTISFGDLRQNTIAEIWRGEKMQEMRRLHATGRRNEVQLCQGCRVFDEEYSLERDKDVAADPTKSFDEMSVARKARKLVS